MATRPENFIVQADIVVNCCIARERCDLPSELRRLRAGLEKDAILDFFNQTGNILERTPSLSLYDDIVTLIVDAFSEERSSLNLILGHEIALNSTGSFRFSLKFMIKCGTPATVINPEDGNILGDFMDEVRAFYNQLPGMNFEMTYQITTESSVNRMNPALRP